MALSLRWTDFICFGIVAASFLGALWFLLRKKLTARWRDDTAYESLSMPCSDAHRLGWRMMNDNVTSSQAWASCWIGVQPVWLLAARAVSLLVMSGFLCWDIIKWDASIFLYYTEWTFTLIMVYFALGIVISAYACWASFLIHLHAPDGPGDNLIDRHVEASRAKYYLANINTKSASTQLQNDNSQETIEENIGFIGCLMQVIYQTCGGAVILTDVVFWCIIVPFSSNARLGLNVLMGSMHVMNVAFLLLETSLNTLTFPWFRLSYFVLWSCLYVVFQWVIHACGFSWWPYPFLELNNSRAPLWYLCLALAHIPCFGAYVLIVKAKHSLFLRLFPNAFVRSIN